MDKQYAGLRELAEDRRKKLDHTYHHFLLSREVDDLEHWISERDIVASSQEMGKDLDHVTVRLHSHVETPNCHKLWFPSLVRSFMCKSFSNTNTRTVQPFN